MCRASRRSSSCSSSSGAGKSINDCRRSRTPPAMTAYDPYSWGGGLLPEPAGPQGWPSLVLTVRSSFPSQRLGVWIRGNAVTNVAPNSPAAGVGLRAGMRVLQVDGCPADPAQVNAAVRRGWKSNGRVAFLVEVLPPGSRSRRSQAKARARNRTRITRPPALRPDEIIDEAAFTACYC